MACKRGIAKRLRCGYQYGCTSPCLMSVESGDLAVKLEAPCLHVRPGHFVIVGGDHIDQGDWWMGQVIFCEGSARHPKCPFLFQVVDVDTGVAKWINAADVSEVIWSMDGWPCSATLQ